MPPAHCNKIYFEERSEIRMHKQIGFTLIELMISMLVGLVAIGAAGSLYLTTLEGSSTIVAATRLHNDLNSTVILMGNDIRRAGFWRGSVSGADGENNPFTQSNADLTITDFSGTSDCVVYSYDFTSNADVTSAPDSNEYYGFRLNNGVIEMRTTLSTAADHTDCSSANGTWIPLTLSGSNEGMTIDALAFNLGSADEDDDGEVEPTSRCVNGNDGLQESKIFTGGASFNCPGTPDDGDLIAVRRVLNISITGSLDTLTETVTASVTLPNDRLLTFEAP